MLPRNDGHDEVADWTLLGHFPGGALAFVRELLADEGIAHRLEPQPGRDGEPAAELWVPALEHARAVALVAAASTEAEAAARREALTPPAGPEPEVTAAVPAIAPSRAAPRPGSRSPSRRQTRRAAKLEARRQYRLSRVPERRPRRRTAVSALRLAGGLLALVVLAGVLISLIGGRYGTRLPVPGRHGPPIHCDRRGNCTS